MKIIEQQNRDLINPSRLELALYRALTGVASLPLTVEQWNDGIQLGLLHWGEAHDHIPQVAATFTTLLDEMRIDESTYEDPDVELVRADEDKSADGNKQ